MDKIIFISNSPFFTQDLGRRVGEKLQEGSIIALIGELGCGKTCFTKGICMGLGIPTRYVNSPTFTFVNEYLGKLPTFHIDLYRVNDITEGLEIGILDYLVKVKSGVAVIEWAEKTAFLLPNDYLEVQFYVLSLKKRKIVITAFGDRFYKLVSELDGR